MHTIAQFTSLASLLLSLLTFMNGAMGQVHNITVVDTDRSITVRNTKDPPHLPRHKHT